MAAFDEAQAEEEGEIVASGRRIQFKAKWHIHSQDEWDARAQDMETGIRVRIRNQNTAKHANQLAIQISWLISVSDAYNNYIDVS